MFGLFSEIHPFCPIQASLNSLSRFESINPWFPGDTKTALSVDFFDNVFTFSNHSSSVTCCRPDNTIELVTCGQGASCAGQCSALGASLCPSGKCTSNPRTCELNFGRDHYQDQERSDLKRISTVEKGNLTWCTDEQHQCRVRAYKECCYNSDCLTWKGRKEACAWLDYLKGNK